MLLALIIIFVLIMTIWQYNTTFSVVKAHNLIGKLPDDDNFDDEASKILNYHLWPTASNWFGCKHWFIPYISEREYEKISDFQ